MKSKGGTCPEQRDDTRQRGGRGRIGGLPGAGEKRLGDLRHRRDQIHRPGTDGAARHAVVIGLLGILGDGEAALHPDGLEADGAVRAGSRKHHPHGGVAIFARQRLQQEIERQARAVRRLGRGEAQVASLYREVECGRNDIEMIRLHRHAVGRLLHHHGGVRGEEIRHQAFMGGIQMQDQDERHPVTAGQL